MSEPPSTRRDFLSGRSAAGALAAAGQGAMGPSPQGPKACTLSLTRRAMACDFQVQLCTDQGRNQTEAGLAALDLIDQLEDRLSVYREHSAIMRLNRAAQQSLAPIDPDLFELLSLCDQIHRDTGGAFDCTTGPLSRAWGFFHRQGRVPTDDQLAQALGLVGWDRVGLDPVARTLRFEQPDAEVNFNGIGKGYALDKSAELLLQEDVGDFLLHGGRSTLVARGDRPAGAAGWGVGLRHPLRPQQQLAEFSLNNRAFSTSGSATQGFVHQGRRYGHLIDPRTGRPAEGVHSVSVLAPTGAQADALSTALYVMGIEEAQRFCEHHPQVGALFVLPHGHPSQVRLEALNLTEDQWRPASPN